MAFQRVCSLDDVWEGEMEAFEVDGEEIVVLHLEGGVVRAIPACCPHQEHPLIEGEFEDGVLICSAHLWEFDVGTGQGINPDDARLVNFPVKIENDEIFVDVKARVTPGDSNPPVGNRETRR